MQSFQGIKSSYVNHFLAEKKKITFTKKALKSVIKDENLQVKFR